MMPSPTNADLPVSSSHEPPLTRPPATLSPPEEGRGQGEGRPRRFMVPMHAKKRKEPSHEPPPLPALSPAPSGGEGGRRSGEGAFTLIAPIQVRILEVFTTHEPGRARHSVRAAVRHCQTGSHRTDAPYHAAWFKGSIGVQISEVLPT